MPTTEAYPLAWPDGWPRVRPQDRKRQSSWKRTANAYRQQLETELKRMGTLVSVVSSNVPVTQRGSLMEGRVEPADVGVAVYFSRLTKPDFGWQDALNIHVPAPTEDEVNDAFRRLSRVHHPDAGGDISMFQSLVKHRDAALRWVRRKQGQTFDYVIACDQFEEVRWNLAAITQTLRAIRQIERCGTSSLLERAFKGFQAIAETASA